LEHSASAELIKENGALESIAIYLKPEPWTLGFEVSNFEYSTSKPKPSTLKRSTLDLELYAPKL
jgi:hypothetical protein